MSHDLVNRHRRGRGANDGRAAFVNNVARGSQTPLGERTTAQPVTRSGHPLFYCHRATPSVPLNRHLAGTTRGFSGIGRRRGRRQRTIDNTAVRARNVAWRRRSPRHFETGKVVRSRVDEIDCYSRTMFLFATILTSKFISDDFTAAPLHAEQRVELVSLNNYDSTEEIESTCSWCPPERT